MAESGKARKAGASPLDAARDDQEAPSGRRRSAILALVGLSVLVALGGVITALAGSEATKKSFTRVDEDYLILAFPDAGGPDSEVTQAVCVAEGETARVPLTFTAHGRRAGTIDYTVTLRPLPAEASPSRASTTPESTESSTGDDSKAQDDANDVSAGALEEIGSLGSVRAPRGETVLDTAAVEAPSEAYDVIVTVDQGAERLVRHCGAAGAAE